MIEHERDETRIILCGKGEKPRKGKLDDDSDDGGDDASASKSLKTKKSRVKSKVNGGKRRC